MTMKKLLALMLVVGVMLLLPACAMQGDTVKGDSSQTSSLTSTNPAQSGVTASGGASVGSTTAITRERAIELALQAASLTENEVFNIEAELDQERGGLVWEVEFETREHEYSYDIHAENGTVTKTERERND